MVWSSQRPYQFVGPSACTYDAASAQNFPLPPLLATDGDGYGGLYWYHRALVSEAGTENEGQASEEIKAEIVAALPFLDGELDDVVMN